MGMKKIVSLAFAFYTFLCLSFIISPQGMCETPTHNYLYVGGTGPGNYTTLHTALQNATSGTTIIVSHGTYRENLFIDIPVNLIGEDKNTTIIDGGGNDFVITLAADDISISGFTITQSGKRFPFAGIYVTSNYNTVAGNILTNNYYGMHMSYNADYNLIFHNLIFHNAQCGIYFNHSSHNRLLENTVHDQPVNGFGLYEFSNNNTIVNNTLSKDMFCGVNIRESYNTYVVGNTFLQDNVGLHVPSPLYNTIAHDNSFSGNRIVLEEEREVGAPALVVFSVVVFLGFLVMKKRYT